MPGLRKNKRLFPNFTGRYYKQKYFEEKATLSSYGESFDRVWQAYVNKKLKISADKINGKEYQIYTMYDVTDNAELLMVYFYPEDPQTLYTPPTSHRPQTKSMANVNFTYYTTLQFLCYSQCSSKKQLKQQERRK